MEYATAFLNNAQNSNDTANGAKVMKLYGIKMSNPKWGASQWNFYFDKTNKVVYKGLNSVKFMSQPMAEELHGLYGNTYNSFMDLLSDISNKTSTNINQLNILIKIDFFTEFGNQRELLRICDLFEKFKRGTAKKIKKSEVDGTTLEPIIKKYSNGKTKSGDEAKSYTFLDLPSVMRECEQAVKDAHMPDLGDLLKVQNYAEIMGYVGYISNKEEDRPKLYIKDIFPVKRKSDGKQFGYNILTQSIGSGIESKFTVFNTLYNKDPIKKGEVVLCTSYRKEGIYFTMTGYTHIYN